jgi:hypothetical protein
LQAPSFASVWSLLRFARALCSTQLRIGDAKQKALRVGTKQQKAEARKAERLAQEQKKQQSRELSGGKRSAAAAASDDDEDGFGEDGEDEDGSEVDDDSSDEGDDSDAEVEAQFERRRRVPKWDDGSV